MEMGESIAVGGLEEEVKAKCPFTAAEAEGADNEDSEDIKEDDTADAERQQHNDGGVLGKNLASGSQGASGTIGGPFTPDKTDEDPRVDTKRKGVHVRVLGTATIPEGKHGFTVAAHHLIPGEAALAPSNLKPFMTRDDSVTIDTGKKKVSKQIAKYIGYNVNGAHNGVWLPGNYFIRARNSPVKGKSWSDLGEDPWCLNYVAAVSRAAGGQIHDAHTKYSDAVKGLLNKIALILGRHECDDCKSEKINPPFLIKPRLYALSLYFRGQLTAAPGAWKRPWFASDRWRDHAFERGAPSKKFMAAYQRASLIQPRGRAR